MPLEGKQGIVTHHAAAVIGDLNQLLAAGLDLYLNALRTRVQRIFQQLFHHGRGPFHNFAGSDFVGNVLGKNVNAPHGSEASFAEGKREGKESLIVAVISVPNLGTAPGYEDLAPYNPKNPDPAAQLLKISIGRDQHRTAQFR